MEMSDWGRKVAQVTLDAVFPPRCAGCGNFSQTVFCAACKITLAPVCEPWCRVCGTPFDPGALAAEICAGCRPNRYHGERPYLAARSAYFFEGPMRHAVHSLKYRGKTGQVPALAALMAEALQTNGELTTPGLQLVVPVPLHPWRRWRRGFNQSELLARSLAKQLGLPARDALCRSRFTPPQVGLTRDERELNIKGSFAVRAGNEPALAGKSVLLVDDVFTTGATCEEAARTLKAAGAREIVVVTLARDS